MGKKISRSTRSSKAKRLFAGIDLGGTNMQIGVVSADGKVRGAARKKTQPEQGRAKVLDRIVSGVQEACHAAGVRVNQLGGLGIGAPGVIDPDTGTVLVAVNLRWDNVPLADLLRRRFRVPVLVDNDVNVAVYGEWKCGAAKGATDVLGVWIGTGIGGGLVLRNELYHGPMFSAGELGHTILLPGAPFGRRTVEENCSRTAVADRLADLMRSNRKSSLAKYFHEGQPLKSRLIAEAYMRKDPLTVRVVNETAHLLGISIAGVVTLLSLDTVVLGGGLTEAVGKALLKVVKQSVDDHVFPERCKAVRIVESELRDNAGLVGAAMLAREKLA